MELVNLALQRTNHPVTAPLPLIILPFALILGLGGGTLIINYVANARLARAAQFEGSAVTGTAQLLSAARAGGLAAWGGTPRGGDVVRRIGLRVSIPGRPPYDVTVTTRVGRSWAYKAIRWPGGTYVVQVDSANPEKVRFDYLQTWPPRGWYLDPSGAQTQRYWDGRQWTASVQPPQPSG